MKKPQMKEYAILGYSRFCGSVAAVLAKHGVQLLVCDKDAQKVQRSLEFASQSIQMDISDEEALRKMDLQDYDVVIVDTGDDIRASSRAVMIAKEVGVPFTIVRVTSNIDKVMLEKLGADMVIFPDLEAGENLAYRMFNSDVMTLLRKIPNFSLTSMSPPEDWIGRTIAEIDVRKLHGIVIFAIERGEEVIAPVGADNVIHENDIMIVWQKEELTN